MPVASSPSDYTSIAPDYANGFGFYTDVGAVADMLQIPEFTDQLTQRKHKLVQSLSALKVWLMIRQSVLIIQLFTNKSFTTSNLLSSCIHITEAMLVLSNYLK